jgi:hypothetical protein
MRVAVHYYLCAALCLFPAVAHSIDTGEDKVKFAPKNFFDNKESVGISGTLTGADLGYKTNTFAITCIKELNHCIVASVQAIGDNHIGRLDYPYLVPIIKWTDYEIVAQEEMSAFTCIRVTFTITRKQEAALWVEEPVNQTTPMCAKSDGKYRKYTIEDPPYWKKMNSKR